MRAKINATIIKDEKGVLLVKVFNGYGDPEIQFVPDSIDFDIPVLYPYDPAGMRNAWPYKSEPTPPAAVKPPLFFRALRLIARIVGTLGYYGAAPIEAAISKDYADFREKRRFGWNSLWGRA
jgi:hypothetical protein